MTLRYTPALLFLYGSRNIQQKGPSTPRSIWGLTSKSVALYFSTT
jgi:hypothetical protein